MKKVLLDENIPRRLKWSISAEVVTVHEHGWSGIKNGELLVRASQEFDVLLTMDQGMVHQQNLTGIDLCIIVLAAISSDIDDLLPLVPSIESALKSAESGKVIIVDE